MRRPPSATLFPYTTLFRSFISTNSPSLTTTSTLTLAPVTFDQNGGTTLVVSAAGVITRGPKSTRLNSRHLGSYYAGISVTKKMPVLNTDAGTTLTVPGGSE